MSGWAGPAPLRYCLSYRTVGVTGDSIRLARTLEWTASGDSGAAFATPFPLDSTHTPRLHSRTGRWARRGAVIALQFGDPAWRYVYDLRPSGDSIFGQAHVETDMHLDRVLHWRVAGRRCPAGAARHTGGA